MNIETKRKYDELIKLIAGEIAEEQENMNNPDYKMPILNKYYMLFNTDFFDNEILTVAKSISKSMKKTPPVGKWDKEAPRSYRNFVKRMSKLR